jgi:hypothetical protein
MQKVFGDLMGSQHTTPKCNYAQKYIIVLLPGEKKKSTAMLSAFMRFHYSQYD